jgi:hypothetical protein
MPTTAVRGDDPNEYVVPITLETAAAYRLEFAKRGITGPWDRRLQARPDKKARK